MLPARAGARTLVVGKSTVPAGTARRLAARLDPQSGVSLLWNPEFLREGFAVRDSLSPDRIVYGLADPEAPGDGAPCLPDLGEGVRHQRGRS